MILRAEIMNVLLDSNSYTSFAKGSHLIKKYLEEADIVYISVIVLGELYAAFKRGRKEEDNLKFLNKFLSKSTVEVIKVTRDTAELYGVLKKTLDELGKPIPVNDLWIASHVFETSSVLITYDKHFLSIPNLRIWSQLK